MGYMDASHVEKAGNHLLQVLKGEPSAAGVRYSRFYDGSEETAERLLRACGFEGEGDAPECTMDVAVWQLAAAGIVEITQLQDRLADGEQDYLIELTPEGRAWLDAGRRFRFRSVDL